MSVLVTSYGRRPYLEGCVKSLLRQSRPPDEIVLVTRRGDEETEIYVTALLASHRGPVAIRHAVVDEPGVLAANRAGLPLATGDLLSFIDDDAEAHADWLERIEKRFLADPSLGALGGRDINHTSKGIDDEEAPEAGRIRWYGRIIGDHHKRVAGCRAAETLKGCNMTFCRDLVAGFDPGIIGNAHYYEMDLCFAVRAAGQRILYDGDIAVDHFVEAPRHLPGNADPHDPRRYFFIHHNRVYVMMKNLSPVRRAVFLVYSFASDAAALAVRFLLGRPEGRPAMIGQVFRGKIEGLKRYRASRGKLTAARRSPA